MFSCLKLAHEIANYQGLFRNSFSFANVAYIMWLELSRNAAITKQQLQTKSWHDTDSLEETLVGVCMYFLITCQKYLVLMSEHNSNFAIINIKSQPS